MNCQILPELELGRTDPQLRHLDRAWASTVHAFQGRTVDNVVAAMEANHPYLTTRKSFYVEISCARDRAELVTDDAARLRDQLEVVTGERISALEGIGEAVGGMPRRGVRRRQAHELDGGRIEKPMRVGTPAARGARKPETRRNRPFRPARGRRIGFRLVMGKEGERK